MVHNIHIPPRTVTPLSSGGNKMGVQDVGEGRRVCVAVPPCSAPLIIDNAKPSWVRLGRDRGCLPTPQERFILQSVDSFAVDLSQWAVLSTGMFMCTLDKNILCRSCQDYPAPWID